jgi:hypothetical protein
VRGLEPGGDTVRGAHRRDGRQTPEIDRARGIGTIGEHRAMLLRVVRRNAERVCRERHALRAQCGIR